MPKYSAQEAIMVRTHSISGSTSGAFQSFGRSILAITAGIGGLFLLIASAIFAMIVGLGLLFLGLIVFAVFWTRAKLLGKPISPYARMRKDFESQMRAMHKQQSSAGSESGASLSGGPVIDAHETPDGWSVDAG